MAIIIQTVDGVVANQFEIGDEPLTFGRSTDNQVRIENSEVSTNHARVVRTVDDKGKAAFFLEDLNSTNGSFVNEARVEQQQLFHKDEIRIGLNVFTFIDESKVDIEKTSEIKKSWIPGVYYTK